MYLLVIHCNFVSCRLDANECAANATLCGDGGTCVNMDNGNFYSCDCSNGFEGNGASASDGALTCVGMFKLTITNFAHVHVYCLIFLNPMVNSYHNFPAVQNHF